MSILIAPALLVFQAPDSWPQWRGPQRDGIIAGTTWPDALEGRINRVWRVPDLGPSYSGPLVGESLVITTETRDEADEVVRAYDRETGDMVWEQSWKGSMSVPFFASKNGSWIRATPAMDDQFVFVAGMRDVLTCIDRAQGEIVWQKDWVAEFETPLPSFGFVSSPLLDETHVYVQAGASFLKVEKRTGDVVWRTLVDQGGMNGSAFSSPVLATIGGVEQLLVLSRNDMAGVDAANGDVLWKTPIKAFRGMNILTPSVHDESVFTATYGGRAQLLELVESEEGLAVESRWDNRAQGYMTSPVIIDGHAYYFTRSNRCVCVRLSDGEIMWISPPTGDEYWSLVAQGDRILALNDTGLLRLIRATPDAYEVVDECRVADAQTWAHLAVTSDPGSGAIEIIVREQGGLALFHWR